MFWTTFYTTVILNIPMFLFLIFKLIKDEKNRRKNALVISAHIFLCAIVSIVSGYFWVSKIDFTDTYIGEGLGWMYLLRIIPVSVFETVLIVVIINFVRKYDLKRIIKLTSEVLNKYSD